MREERKGTGRRRWGRPGEREGEDPGGSARRERERGDPWGGGGGEGRGTGPSNNFQSENDLSLDRRWLSEHRSYAATIEV